MLRGSIVASILCAALFFTPYARAAGDSESGAAAAESLFQEGRKLMESKRYPDACSKFAASQKLAPAIGTLLNLADCYEKNNQLASAWARFHEAIALAQRLGRSNREQTARERAEKLEGRLIKLTIFAHASNIEVKLDGNPVDPTVLGTPIPIDAGKHSIEATAKNKKPFSKELELSERAKAPSVDIPLLEDLPQPKETKASDPPRPRPEHHDGVRGGWATQKTLGVVAAGVGVVGLGVGVVFGLKTSTTWEDAQSHCSSTLECDPEGFDLASQAKTSGNIATVAVLAGSAILIGGAVLFLTAPTEGKMGGSRAPLRLGVGPGALVLGGKF